MEVLQLWTAPQAVEFLHRRGLTDIDEKWFRNRFDNGDLPCTVVGRKRRIRSDVVEALFNTWLRGAL